MSLERLRLAADRLAPVDPVLAGWLAEALEDLRIGIPPAEALQLTTGTRRAHRDAALRRAADMLPGTDWQKARTLAAWCRWYAGDGDQAPGDDHSDMESLLRAARASGLDLPESERQVYRILTDTEAHS